IALSPDRSLFLFNRFLRLGGSSSCHRDSTQCLYTTVLKPSLSSPDTLVNLETGKKLSSTTAVGTPLPYPDYEPKSSSI
ncbi:MAG TPA: hypothetical protein V6D50_10735, partial [Chroococcales cyanobacterium]